MQINKIGKIVVKSPTYVNSKGELCSFKRFDLENFKNHINKYDNCLVVDKSELEDYEFENMHDQYGDFEDTFLLIVDYPGIGFVNYFFIETDETYFLCLFGDKLEINDPEEFIEKMAYLAEYKVI